MLPPSTWASRASHAPNRCTARRIPAVHWRFQAVSNERRPVTGLTEGISRKDRGYGLRAPPPSSSLHGCLRFLSCRPPAKSVNFFGFGGRELERTSAMNLSSVETMPVKHVVVDLYPPLQNQQVRGWHFRVVGTGKVQVGTAKQGPYKRWTFSLPTTTLTRQPVCSPRSRTGEHLSVPPRLAR